MRQKKVLLESCDRNSQIAPDKFSNNNFLYTQCK